MLAALGCRMAKVWYTLSVKQPWAALLVAGVKTIEVRTWPTTVRGPVLIHAGKKADDREEGWALVSTPELAIATQQLGGVIGVADLFGCIGYRTLDSFVADRAKHHNEPGWYNPKRMYGFEFRNARPLPFLACPGNTFFFKVEGIELS